MVWPEMGFPSQNRSRQAMVSQKNMERAAHTRDAPGQPCSHWVRKNHIKSPAPSNIEPPTLNVVDSSLCPKFRLHPMTSLHISQNNTLNLPHLISGFDVNLAHHFRGSVHPPPTVPSLLLRICPKRKMSLRPRGASGISANEFGPVVASKNQDENWSRSFFQNVVRGSVPQLDQVTHGPNLHQPCGRLHSSQFDVAHKLWPKCQITL